MTLTFTAFPEVETSSLRELQWAEGFWKRTYADAGYQSDVAWKLYGDAIDDQEPQDAIEQLFIIAEMFDAIKSDAWHKWQDAQARYLAMMN